MCKHSVMLPSRHATERRRARGRTPALGLAKTADRSAGFDPCILPSFAGDARVAALWSQWEPSAWHRWLSVGMSIEVFFNRYGCFWLDDPVLTCFECGIDVMFCAETFSGRGRPPAPGARGAAHGLRC